jgi:hypothetical protein
MLVTAMLKTINLFLPAAGYWVQTLEAAARCAERAIACLEGAGIFG